MRKTMLLCILFLFALVGSPQINNKALTNQQQVKNTVINFYKWYNTNWKKIEAFKLFKSKKGNDGPPYFIDWNEVERYFSYLRKNVPYVGEGFITQERKHFKKAEQDFKRDPEEEMPSGFDYDRITQSQEEPKWFLDELLQKDNRWVITVQKNGTAKVSIYQKHSGHLPGPFFCYDMAKEKAHWTIVKIGCDADY